MVMGSSDPGSGEPPEASKPDSLEEDPRLLSLTRELKIREREERAARREMYRLTERLARAAPMAERERAEYATRVRKLEQTVSTLSLVLGQVRGDIERALASRA